MRTVHPSIIIGSYTWDQDRLPRDEFQIRTKALHDVMDANGWKAVLIYGDAAAFVQAWRVARDVETAALAVERSARLGEIATCQR